jgi:hypothetical protein
MKDLWLSEVQWSFHSYEWVRLSFVWTPSWYLPFLCSRSVVLGNKVLSRHLTMSAENPGSYNCGGVTFPSGLKAGMLSKLLRWTEAFTTNVTSGVDEKHNRRSDFYLVWTGSLRELVQYRLWFVRCSMA